MRTTNDSIEELYKQLNDFRIPYIERKNIAEKIEKQTDLIIWVPLSPQERQLHLEQQKQAILEYKKSFPNLRCQETDYFLFVSDAPEPFFNEIVRMMDKTYSKLCEVYNIRFEYVLPDGTVLADDTRSIPKGAPKKRQNIWQSKCVVVVLTNENDFNRFESEFFKNDIAEDVTGNFHSNFDGFVTITCKTRENKDDFYATLVHEITHGFMSMYPSKFPLPRWLEEGIADWTAGEIVPSAKQIKDKQKEAVDYIQKRQTIADLFTTDDPEYWQYGATSLLVTMLIKENPKAFIQFIDDIKFNTSAEESLKRRYGYDYSILKDAFVKATCSFNEKEE